MTVVPPSTHRRAAVAAELGAWLFERYRLVVLPVNLVARAIPSLLAGFAFEALAGGRLDACDPRARRRLGRGGLSFPGSGLEPLSAEHAPCGLP